MTDTTNPTTPQTLGDILTTAVDAAVAYSPVRKSKRAKKTEQLDEQEPDASDIAHQRVQRSAEAHRLKNLLKAAESAHTDSGKWMGMLSDVVERDHKEFLLCVEALGDEARTDMVWKDVVYTVPEEMMERIGSVWELQARLSSDRNRTGDTYYYTSTRYFKFRAMDLNTELLNISFHKLSSRISGMGANAPLPHTTVIYGVKVRGFHFGEPVAELPPFAMIADMPVLGRSLLILGRKGVMVFPSQDAHVRVPNMASLVQSALSGRAMHSDAVVQAWSNHLMKTTLKAIKTDTRRIKELYSEMEKLTGRIAVSKRIMSSVSADCANATKVLMSGMEQAGLRFDRYSMNGLIFITEPIWMSLGGHDNQHNDRYLGVFEVKVGVSYSMSIRNIASPRADLNHVVFDQDTCMGSFSDVLRNCVTSMDFYTYGLTIMSLLTHFGEDYDIYVRKLPKGVPEKTFPQSEFKWLFGVEENIDMGEALGARDSDYGVGERGDRDDDDDDEE